MRNVVKNIDPVDDESIYTEVGFKLNKLRISVRMPKSCKGQKPSSIKKESSFKSYNSTSLIQSIRSKTSKELDVTADDWHWQPSPNGSFGSPQPSPRADDNAALFSDPVHNTLKAKANVRFIQNDLKPEVTSSKSAPVAESSSAPPVPPRRSPSTPPPSARPPYPSSTVKRNNQKSQQQQHHKKSPFVPVSGTALESARRKYYL